MKARIQFTEKTVHANKEQGTVRVMNYARIYIDDIPEVRCLMQNFREIEMYVCRLMTYRCDDDGKDYVVINGIGKAKCHPTDTFDEHTGFVLADTRSQKNIYKKAEKFFDDLLMIVDKKVYNSLSDRLTCYGDMVYRCEDHENEILGEE